MSAHASTHIFIYCSDWLRVVHLFRYVIKTSIFQYLPKAFEWVMDVYIYLTLRHKNSPCLYLLSANMSLIFFSFFDGKKMSFNFNPCSNWWVILLEQRVRKSLGWLFSCRVFVNSQAVAAGSLINLATILYLNSIRVSCSHPASLFFPCGDYIVN